MIGKIRALALAALGQMIVACGEVSSDVTAAACKDDLIDATGFLDEWYSVKKPCPHGSGLKLHRSGRFDYGIGACMYSGSAAGQWSLSGETLVLLSDTAHGCYRFDDFDMELTLNFGVAHDRWKARPERWSTSDTCDVSYYDDAIVVFNEERFVIRQDTLVHCSHFKVADIRFSERFVRTGEE